MLRLSDLPIRWRILLLGLVAMAGLAAVLVLTIGKLEQTMRADARASAQRLVEAADALVDAYAAREQRGELGGEEARAEALHALSALRTGDAGALWVIQLAPGRSPTPLLPPLRDAPAIMRAVSAAAAARRADGVLAYPLAESAGRGEPATLAAEAYVRHAGSWGWVVGADVYSEGIAATIRQTIFERALLVSVVTLAFAALSLVLATPSPPRSTPSPCACAPWRTATRPARSRTRTGATRSARWRRPSPCSARPCATTSP